MECWRVIEPLYKTSAPNKIEKILGNWKNLTNASLSVEVTKLWLTPKTASTNTLLTQRVSVK